MKNVIKFTVSLLEKDARGCWQGRRAGEIGSALSENVCVINDERRKSIIASDGGEVFARKLSARVSEP